QCRYRIPKPTDLLCHRRKYHLVCCDCGLEGRKFLEAGREIADCEARSSSNIVESLLVSFGEDWNFGFDARAEAVHISRTEECELVRSLKIETTAAIFYRLNLGRTMSHRLSNLLYSGRHSL